MGDKSSLVVTAEQRAALKRLARSADREEADRARGILLSDSGWTSPEIGDALRVREDTVRSWRSAFMREGLEAIVRHAAPGRAPVKAQAALAVAGELLTAPVENRANWTLPRLCDEIERRSGHRISRSRLSVVLRKKGAMPASGPATR
jgi:transposase